MGGVAWSIPTIPAEKEYCEQATRALLRIREEMKRLRELMDDHMMSGQGMMNGRMNEEMMGGQRVSDRGMNGEMMDDHMMSGQGMINGHMNEEMMSGQGMNGQVGQPSYQETMLTQPSISQPSISQPSISPSISQPSSISQSISQPSSISQSISQPPQPPRKDFYDATKDLFLSLLRAGDLRDISQLQTFLGVQAKIRQLMRQHAPPETLRPLQMSIPNPLEIRDRYSNRERVPNVFEELKTRLQACDPTMAERTLAMIPDDPVMFVEMNSLQRLLDLVDVLQFNTGIVEIASVKENELFVQHWTKIMLECRKIITESKQWMDSVEEDIKEDVLASPKTREWIQGRIDDVG